MSKKSKNKLSLAVAIGVVSLVLFGLLLVTLQTNLAINSQKKDTKLKLSQMDELIETAETSGKEATEAFDDIYKGKVESIAYIAEKQQGFESTQEKLRELKEVTEVTNIIILDNKGNQVAAAQESAADFTYDRFNQLRTVFGSRKVSEPFEVEIEGIRHRYYGASIDSDRIVVVEQGVKELDDLLAKTSTWESILSNVSVGLDGFAFAISSQDYTFSYYPEEEMIGHDAIAAGIDVTQLENNNYEWMTINGERLYCGVSKVDDTYIVCAVTEEEITASRNMTVLIVLFIFGAVLTLVILYAAFTLRERARSNRDEETDFARIGSLYFDKTVGRKIGTVAVVGLVTVLGTAFYMQTLLSISRQFMSNEQHVKEVQKLISDGEKNVEELTKQYNERYLNKGEIAAYILSRSPELQTKEELETISKILQVEFVDVFDGNGVKTHTNSMYTKFKISSDPEDQSYEFNKLLIGASHVVQEAQKDETSGEYRQYIGVALQDEAGIADGFVQIAVTPSKLEEALRSTDISYILQKVKVGAKGFAFAVDKKDNTFVYYPNERLIGKKATNYGMEANQFRDEYDAYMTIQSDRYYGSSIEAKDYYVYTVVPVSEMTNNRTMLALVSAAAALISLVIIFLILSFGKQKKITDHMEKSQNGPMIDVVMPDGSIRKTDTAASRWSNISIGWDEKTSEQQIFTVLRWIFGVLTISISAAVIFKDSLLHHNSVLLYVLGGKWERGMNIFAVTAALMVICVVSMVTIVLKQVLRTLARTFGAKGETICRLLGSFVKYASVLIMLYYCLALVGVDTKTLLASAGILSLVVGLGAKSLVEDILAGLFIIFEGEFRVGDIVTIGDWRGTVIEIGIRTTKVEEGSKNIKVISNSQVSGVINMTKFHSYASADIGIEYGESLERVESILEKELPKVKARVKSIQEGPFYKGVVSLADSSVVIRIVAQCAEADRIQLGRDLNRELKILFDNNDINIPFPQVVVNEPTEFKEATMYEKRRADAFNKKQAELSKDLEEEPK